MALARFFDRIADASLPLLDDPTRDALVEILDKTAVGIRLPLEHSETHSDAFRLAVNLAARLYPVLRLEGPRELVAESRAVALAINPDIEFSENITHALVLDGDAGSAAEVHVLASAWNVVVDGGAAGEREAPAGPAQLAAAAIGMAAVFRCVFATGLDRPRHEPEPGSMNLVTLDTWRTDIPVPSTIHVGRVHAAGVGALGQAAVLTLKSAGARGELVVVDDESVDVSNLQRYVLSHDCDVEMMKVDVAARALADTALHVIPVPAKWGMTPETAPYQEVVLVGLDSWENRIEVQAGLHDRIYNAYTQPLDIGWSRHERFGTDPCLACMYWPTKPLPDYYQLVAAALGQPPGRVRRYLSSELRVGDPLPGYRPLEGEQFDQVEIIRWTHVPILEDLKQTFDLAGADWSHSTLDDFYSGVVCGGAGVRIGARPEEVVVPLAHQSAMAGIMLAVQLLVASDPQLRLLRPTEVEARLNMLGALPPSFSVPATPVPNCICSDADFLAACAAKERAGALS